MYPMKIIILSLLMAFVKTTGFKIEHVQHKGDHDITIRQLVFDGDSSNVDPIELKNEADKLDQNVLLVIEKLLSPDLQRQKLLDAELGPDIKTAIKKILNLKSIELKKKAEILGIDLPTIEITYSSSDDGENQLQRDDDTQFNGHSINIKDISSEIEKLNKEAEKRGPDFQEVMKQILELEPNDQKISALKLGPDTLAVIEALFKLPENELKEKAVVLGIPLPIGKKVPVVSSHEQSDFQADVTRNNGHSAIASISDEEIEELRKKVYEKGEDFKLAFDKILRLNIEDQEFINAGLGIDKKSAFEKLLNITSEELTKKFPDVKVIQSTIVKPHTSPKPQDQEQTSGELGLNFKSLDEISSDLKPLDPKLIAPKKLGPDAQSTTQNLLGLPTDDLRTKAFIDVVSPHSTIILKNPLDPEGLNYQADGVDEKKQSLGNVHPILEIQELLKKTEKLDRNFQLVIDELLFIDPEEPRFKAAGLGPDTQTAIKSLLELPIEKLKDKAKVLCIELVEDEKLSVPPKVLVLEEQADEPREDDFSSSNINAFPELETLKEKAKKIGPGFNMLFEKILSFNPDSSEFEIVNLGSGMKKSLENLFLLDIEGLELLAADLGIDPHVFKTTPLCSATRELNPEVETSDEKVYLESMKNTSPSLKELDIQGDDPEEGNFLNRNINSQALEESDKINTIEGPKHKVRPKLKDKISQNNELEFVKNNRQDKINAKNNIPSQKSENIFKNQSQSKKDNRINLYSIGDDPQAVSSYENVLNSNYSKKPSVPSQKYDVDGLKTLHSPIINFKVETSPQVFNKPKKPVSEDNFEGLKLTSNVSDTREQGNPKFVKNEQHDNVKKGIRLDAAIKSPYDGLQPRIVLKFTISRTGH